MKKLILLLTLLTLTANIYCMNPEKGEESQETPERGQKRKRRILDEFVNISTPDNFGIDALQEAIKKEDFDTAFEIIELFQKQGKTAHDFNRTNASGERTIFLAAQHLPELITLFITKPLAFDALELYRHLTKFNKVQEALYIAFFYAQHYMGTGIIKQLIKKGADINAPYLTPGFSVDEKLTLLMITALSKVQINELEMLLKLGASIDVKNSQGNTALMYAVMRNNPEAVEALLAAGANVNASNNDGVTSLMFAAQYTQSIIKALINAGASITATDTQGRTALKHAMEQINYRAIEALLYAYAEIKEEETAAY